MHLKLFQKEKTKIKAEGTGDSIGNRIDNKITKASRTSPKNSSERESYKRNSYK